MFYLIMLCCYFPNNFVCWIFLPFLQIIMVYYLAVPHFSFNGFSCRVPVDPLEWQISQDMANSIVASLANTIGAAESVLRVAATGHDKKLFFKVCLVA